MITKPQPAWVPKKPKGPKWPGRVYPVTPPAPLLSPPAWYTLHALEKLGGTATVHQIWKEIARWKLKCWPPHTIYQCLLRGEAWDPPLYKQNGTSKTGGKGRPGTVWEITVECQALRRKE
jgi:hypothetical protein